MTNCVTCGVETTNPKFCSRSCSAKHNNRGVRRHKAPQKSNLCHTCGAITKNNMYCSYECTAKGKKLKRDELILSHVNVSWKKLKQYMHDNYDSCFVCGLGKVWNARPLTLQCDHIDGDVTNNTLSNIRLLCPNCHSQTDTYGSKNKNNPNGYEQRRKRLRYHR